MDRQVDADRGGSPEMSVFTSAEGEAEVLRAYERVMHAWPTPYTELAIATSFGVTHVVASGPADGPPVVLLHAYMATSGAWYRNVTALSDAYRVYCVDVIGDANRSRPTRPLASMEDYETWFGELLEGLGCRDVHLIGNSFGGFAAAWLAQALPGRVRSLVLIGPAATIHRMPAFYRNMFAPKLLQLLAPWLPGVDRLVVRGVRWAHAGLPADPLWAPLFTRTLLHGRPVNRVFPRVLTPEELSGIAVPVLVLLGGRERIYDPAAAAAAAARLLPDAEVEIVPDAHHITALSQPDAVNQRILAFLAAHGADAAGTGHPAASGR